MDKIKIRIKDEFHSRQVQDAMFQAGYGWRNGGKLYSEYEHLNMPFIYGEFDGRIMYGEWPENFDEQNHTEMVLKYSLEVYVERDKVRETVKIGEHTYYKDEFEKAVANLKTV